jgi:beta-glucosidase-like glycosyl hydrolase
MVAHLNIPGIDTTRNLASTLSPKIVTDLLKNKMNFKGLVFTDALNMKGVSKFFEPGIVDVKALLAGNDVMLFSEDVPKAISEINKAISEGKIKRETIDERCKKILKAKYWCGLNANAQIVTRNIYEELNSKVSETLNDQLAEAAVTLLKNDAGFLPLKKSENAKIIEVSFGSEEKNGLYNTLKDYAAVEHVALTHDASTQKIKEVFEKIKLADLVIVQVNKTTLKGNV